MGVAVVDAWEERRAGEERRRRELIEGGGGDGGTGKGKGKAPVEAGAEGVEGTEGGDAGAEARAPLDQLVLLACRHIYHRKCIDALQVGEEGHGEYRCPIDG